MDINEISQGQGYVADKPDAKDYKYEDRVLKTAVNTTIVEPCYKYEDIDLVDKYMPDIYNQGQTNMCVIFQVMSSIERQLSMLYAKKFNTDNFRFNGTMSKRFLYYLSRLNDANSDVNVDSGTSYRYAYMSAIKTGVCNGVNHPDTSELDEMPSFEAAINANDFKINAFYSIDTLEGIVDCLRRSIEVSIGINIDACSDARATGFSAKSALWNTVYPGTHGVGIVGIKNFATDPDFSYAKIRNSWGTAWGEAGYFYIRLDYLWKYNLDSAWMAVMDKTSYDIVNEDSTYGKLTEIPVNTIVIGNYAYDLNYANNVINMPEIQSSNLLSTNAFVKSMANVITDNKTGKVATLSDIKLTVKGNIIYKDASGVVKEIIM